MHLKVSSVKWRPFCLGLNVLSVWLFCAKVTAYINSDGVHIYINSLAPGRCGSNFESIFKLILQISSLGTCCEIALMGLLQNVANEKSILVQVMAWCRQAPSHYLRQSWLRSMSPYNVTRPQLVNLSNVTEFMSISRNNRQKFRVPNISNCFIIIDMN